MAPLRKKQLKNIPDVKPYNFCCRADLNEPISKRNVDFRDSLDSIRSLHECPALRLLTQEIVKRPKQSTNDITWDLNSPDTQFGGQKLGFSGKMRFMPTESEIELAIDEERKRRQEEYERNMDRWADMAVKRIAKDKKKVIKCFAPCWYTELSDLQLKYLRLLEDAMFKDKEEKTINRTWDCLNCMGVVTKAAKVESKVLRKLIVAYRDDSLRFLCEIYKALTGKHFEEEGPRNSYLCHERIILSGIVFLELPKVIIELHKRLAPIENRSFLSKPEPAAAIIPKKMESPYLEKLRVPVNWRLYEAQLFDWHQKYSKSFRPIVVLPKSKTIPKNRFKSIDVDNKVKINVGDISVEPETNEDTTGAEKKPVIETDSVFHEGEQFNGYNSQEINIDQDKNSDNHNLLSMKADWTIPQASGPYCKYRSVQDQKAQPKTNEQFFSELNIDGKKEFPCGRENLSLNMQAFLLDVEADFFKLTAETDRITGAVNEVVKQIQQAELTCDPCCPCKQIKKQHIKWHATKEPCSVIDAVVVDGKNKGRVIGAVSLNSPASSVSSLNQPICIPSKEKLVKSKVIAGATVTADGQVVNLIDGCTKAYDHVPTECFQLGSEEIKNVPSCGCGQERMGEEDDLPPDGKNDRYKDVCFGKKFRPNEGPAYVCPDFGKTKKRAGDECGCEDKVVCLESECSDEEDQCEEDQSALEYVGWCKEFEHPEPMELEREDKREMCKKCGKRIELSCAELFSEKTVGSKDEKKVVKKCSCNSLSEFLQMDITNIKCTKPPKYQFKRDLQKEKRCGKGKSKSTSKSKGSRAFKAKHKEERARAESARDSKEKEEGEVEEKSVTGKAKGEEEVSKASREELDEGRLPYGCRTKSEEALPPQRTIAYLVDLHPPEIPAQMIAVREGGRPCRCRENRNQRKTLIYNIGALGMQPDVGPVIEGIHWLSPVPSIRRSDEYIPEYELYDSPYGKPRKPGAAAKNEEADNIDEDGDKQKSRERGWNIASKDVYLNDFFTSKRGKRGPCTDVCPKCQAVDPEPRQLKVMKPVCECKYERKIVKREEERKKWSDRQKRLKAMDKQSYLHITEISRPTENNELEEKCDSYESDRNSTQMVIAEITIQTPCVTPSSSREQSNLPFVPLKSDLAEEKKSESHAGSKNLPLVEREDALSTSKALKKKSPRVGESESATNVPRKRNHIKNESLSGANQKQNNDVSKDNNIVDKKEKKADDKKLELSSKKIDKHKRRRTSTFFNNMEENLKSQVQKELQKMAQEDFITVNLPDYHIMPQILYWISYRVRGMHFTEKYKNKLMNESLKMWREMERKVEPVVVPETLEVSKKERDMLNFDHAFYWKKRIAKKHLEFYSNIREEVVNYGRAMWRMMEYGKFPNVLFKQAFFTYIPPREKDAKVFRTD